MSRGRIRGREIRVSCGTPKEKASPDLVRRITQLGLTPIITPTIIRAVYQGPSRVVADTLVEIFEAESEHEITLDDPQKKH